MIKVKNVPTVQLVGIFVQWVFALNRKKRNQNDLLLDLNLMLEWKICQLEIFTFGDNGQVALDLVDLVSLLNFSVLFDLSLTRFDLK